MNELVKKNIKKILILIFLFMFFLLIYGGARIYALFHSELNSKIQQKNGNWNIIINNTDVTQGKDIKFNIDSISVEENEHVKTGTLAPGLTGHFNIIIDPQNTDVSVKYEISLDENELKNSNLIIKSIKEKSEENKLIKVGPNDYVGVILLEKIKNGQKDEITVEIEWLDNEENKETDIEIGQKSDSHYKIPLTVHVCQYLGENIEAYTEP